MVDVKFTIECRLKTWKERTLKEKFFFWKQYKTALFPIDDNDLYSLLEKKGVEQQ